MARTAEETRTAKREHMARRRRENPEAVREYQRQQHSKNREYNAAKMRAYYIRRFFWGRAMKLRGSDRATTADISRLWKQQKGCCALTGRRMDRTAQLDHITAKAMGGGDNTQNLRWVCAPANLAKREMADMDFVSLCVDVARMHGAVPVMRRIGERIEAVNGLLLQEAVL